MTKLKDYFLPIWESQVNEKYKDYIWFYPKEAKFLFLDTFLDFDVYSMVNKGQVRFLKKGLHQGEWMLKYEYVDIQYQIQQGKPYLLLIRKHSDEYVMKTSKCAFCGQRHLHTPTDGHRVAHCGNKERGEKIYDVIEALDGTKLYRKDGYVLKSYIGWDKLITS